MASVRQQMDPLMFTRRGQEPPREPGSGLPPQAVSALARMFSGRGRVEPAPGSIMDATRNAVAPGVRPTATHRMPSPESVQARRDQIEGTAPPLPATRLGGYGERGPLPPREPRWMPQPAPSMQQQLGDPYRVVYAALAGGGGPRPQWSPEVPLQHAPLRAPGNGVAGPATRPQANQGLSSAAPVQGYYPDGQRVSYDAGGRMENPRARRS